VKQYWFMDVVVPLGGLIPMGVAIRRYGGLSRPGRWLLAYLCFTTAANVTALWLAANWVNNMPLLHLDTLVETTLFVLFFKRLFRGGGLAAAANLVLAAFPLICILNVLFLGIYSFNTYPRSLEAIILIAFSSAYWLTASRSDSAAAPMWRNIGSDWFVSGIQLYFTSSMFLFIYSNFLAARSGPGTNIMLWNMHGGITFAMYMFFAKGFSLCRS